MAQRHDTEPYQTLPWFDRTRAVMITGRPEMDRVLTGNGWRGTATADLLLECRPDGMPHETTLIARYKAETATRLGCTHYVESDPAQTILIAAHAPHLVVSWWSAADARAFLVGATPTHEHDDGTNSHETARKPGVGSRHGVLWARLTRRPSPSDAN